MVSSYFFNRGWWGFLIGFSKVCIKHNARSHFILGGLSIWVWDTGKVKDRFGGMGRFKCGLKCKGWINSVIVNSITEIRCRCNYM